MGRSSHAIIYIHLPHDDIYVVWWIDMISCMCLYRASELYVSSYQNAWLPLTCQIFSSTF